MGPRTVALVSPGSAPSVRWTSHPSERSPRGLYGGILALIAFVLIAISLMRVEVVEIGIGDYGLGVWAIGLGAVVSIAAAMVGRRLRA